MRRLGLFLVVAAFAAVPASAQRSRESYDTITLGAGRAVWTQTAYTAVAAFGLEAGLSNPSDLFVDSWDRLWVADTDNSRVVSYDQESGAWEVWGEDLLDSPRGVFVDGEGILYVADADLEEVLVFDTEGRLMRRIGRPESPLYGEDTRFRPLKLVVDGLGTITLVSEGATEGLVQISGTGDFLGFFGANTTPVTINMIIQRFLFSAEQRERLIRAAPPSPDNVSIDDEGIIHSITRGVEENAIRKLNVAGGNMLPSDVGYWFKYSDLDVGPNGHIYVVATDGVIEEYDPTGNLLFAFSGQQTERLRLGLTRDASGIAVDSAGTVFLLDRAVGLITAFYPTDFARLVHRGIGLFQEGRYEESLEPWQQVLALNDLFALAHTGIGQALFKRQRYAEALEAFEYSMYMTGWSDAFWEVRNQWLQANLGTLILVLAAIAIVLGVIRRLDRRFGVLSLPRALLRRAGSVRLVSDVFYIFPYLRHPIEGAYDIRREGRTSVPSALILYVLLGVVHTAGHFARGFLFGRADPVYFDLGMNLVLLYVPIALWVLANYLVSAVTEGEGRFRDVFQGTIYAVSPYILFVLPLSFLSRALTLNEAFLFSFGLNVVLAWCAVNLFIMVKEIHNFGFGATIKNILVTAFAMAILVLVGVILFVLWDQMWDFFYSIVQEVGIRV